MTDFLGTRSWFDRGDGVSFDLRNNRVYANPGDERSLDAAMRAAGAKSKIREHEFTLIYVFDEGQVELAQPAPRRKEPPIPSEVQGYLVRTERTEQILAGKVTDRVCGEPPVRDLFDCAAAERYDPRALRKAVERTPSGVRLNAALKQAFGRREAYRRLAESGIAEAHEDLAQAKADPARCAVNVVTSVAVREGAGTGHRPGAREDTVDQRHGSCRETGPAVRRTRTGRGRVGEQRRERGGNAGARIVEYHGGRIGPRAGELSGETEGAGQVPARNSRPAVQAGSTGRNAPVSGWVAHRRPSSRSNHHPCTASAPASIRSRIQG